MKERPNFYDFLFLMLIIGVIIISTLNVNKLNERIKQNSEWIENIQHILRCTTISTPCVKCGNTVYNTLQLGDGPYVSNSDCAKCGRPHESEENRLIKLFKDTNQ